MRRTRAQRGLRLDEPTRSRSSRRLCVSDRRRRRAGQASRGASVSVAEAAHLLGRDRTRVYALLRSGDLVAVEAEEGEGPVRVERSSVERWLVAAAHAAAR